MTAAKVTTGASGQRWDSLDSLRGIAALLVVTFHCAQVTAGFAIRTNPLVMAAWADPWTWLKYTPLRILVGSGPSAVVLFFVLSGFVLSLPFLRADRLPGYAGFAAKRICRIYLPFAAAILLSAALYWLVEPKPMPSLSQWFNTVLWDQPLSMGYLGRNLAMTGLTPDMTLDLVMWSLVHELRISLVFPFLFLATRRWPAVLLVGSVLLSVVCAETMAGREASTLPMSLVDTGRFVFLFVAGILMANRVAELRQAARELSNETMVGLGVLAGVLILSPGPTVYRHYNLVWGLGAVILLVLTVSSLRVERALSARAPVWLGRVSYSLYLVHLPILIGTVHLADGLLPLWMTVVAAIAISLLCAEAMHRAVEIPSMRAGRILARWLDRGKAGPVAAAWPGLRETHR